MESGIQVYTWGRWTFGVVVQILKRKQGPLLCMWLLTCVMTRRRQLLMTCIRAKLTNIMEFSATPFYTTFIPKERPDRP